VKYEGRRFTLIKVIDDYYIEIDNAKGCINYIVRRGSMKIDEKGRNRDTLLGFCGTMGQAISLIREQIIANKLMDGFHALSEALAVVKSETNRLMKALEEKGIEK
jgi:hypothetical protein